MAKGKVDKKTKNGPVKKAPVAKRDMKTQTTRDFCSQITRKELESEMAEISALKMTGKVMEHNGYKIRKPKPSTRDVMTMTSRDVATQVHRDTLAVVHQEVKFRGQSEQGPIIVAFKPQKRRPKYQRPRPPQRSIKTQTSRDFGGQVTAQEIRQSFTEDMAGGENGYVDLPSSKTEEKVAESEAKEETVSQTIVTTATVTTTTTTTEDASEEWKLEVVDDDGMNATFVKHDDEENLIQDSQTNVFTSGVDNPGYDTLTKSDDIEITNITNGVETVTVDDDENEEEFSTFL
ncbi:uncharacterized protein LOC144436715 [Glandiceps talaboti]